MKGKRYTTEDKIRTLRKADGGKSIVNICREKNLSEVMFHRWKRQFGHMELNEARVVIEDFRCEYNYYRPHSKLGYLSPSRFAAQRASSSTAVGLRPPFVGDGQTRIYAHIVRKSPARGCPRQLTPA